MHATMSERAAGRPAGVSLPRLAARRRERLMTQVDLAAAASVATITIKRAERGERVSFDVTKKLANALGVPPDDLR